MEIIADYQNVKIIRMKLGVWDTNSYIIIDPLARKSALIDVPAGARTILSQLKGTQLEWIMLTHSHQDHIGGLVAVRNKLLAALVVHPLDNEKWLPVKPDMEIHDHDTLLVGALKLEVMHTPGHTPGSLCFRLDKFLFAGDSVFPGGPGRTTTPQEFQKAIKSITEKILTLPDNTVIYPGHGRSTTVKKVKKEYAGFALRQHAADLCGDVTWDI